MNEGGQGGRGKGVYVKIKSIVVRRNGRGFPPPVVPALRPGPINPVFILVVEKRPQHCARQYPPRVWSRSFKPGRTAKGCRYAAGPRSPTTIFPVVTWCSPSGNIDCRNTCPLPPTVWHLLPSSSGLQRPMTGWPAAGLCRPGLTSTRDRTRRFIKFRGANFDVARPLRGGKGGAAQRSGRRTPGRALTPR